MGLEDLVTTAMQRYIVTAAEIGAPPYHKMLDAMESYAETNGAKVLVIPIEGQNKDFPLHKRYNDYELLTEDTSFRFSKFLQFKNFGVKAQQINPLTGLRRFGQTSTSYIVGSPKQQLEYAANSNSGDAKALISTGSSTLPFYRDNRIGRIAAHDHVQGGVVVEVADDDTFQFRHFQASLHDGSFVDIGYKYARNKEPRFVGADTVVLGDLHSGQIDGQAFTAAMQMVDDLQPRYVILHDVFDGYSISHHDTHKLITRGKKAEVDALSLRGELTALGELLTEISQHGRGDKTKFLVVKANHDMVLDRYLEEGRFTSEPRNLYLSCRLATAMMDGYDPIETGISEVGIELPKNIKFLTIEEDFRRYGWQLSSHGHMGPSGSRGSMNSLEYSLGKAVVGHTHSAAMLRNLYRVGTLTRFDLDYTKGATGNWTHHCCAIYNNGKAQLMDMRGGGYHYE